jgi:hypothetical protein
VPEDACLRAGCGHSEEDHDPFIGYCERCGCRGYLTAALFGPGEPVPEYHVTEEDDGA